MCVYAFDLDSLWSPQEDAECPLCLEEMDISDLNFKPCPCGYQVGILNLSFTFPSAHATFLLRFANSAGITSRRISTAAALRAGESIPMRRSSSSPYTQRSEC